ncbi:RHS repeat-associated core domain-containing protein [Geofilum rhodophaeum]|uniref:RHS repeat-associated core domain-containing protein n=1 Tax=Geofilum rhodophaeum TaxID=1965019 RepID=UPI0011BAD5EA|nr:RHS repeat-associated core domain-containing protein [Geofilum rhodophaeum]
MTDYYPYGMDMPGRSFQSEAYRYGYQGSERDPEMSGGAGYTTYFRALDPRIGRWLTPDPKVFPWQSPYVSMDGNPVTLIDPWGASTGGGGKENSHQTKGGNGNGPIPCPGDKSSTTPTLTAADLSIMGIRQNLIQDLASKTDAISVVNNFFPDLVTSELRMAQGNLEYESNVNMLARFGNWLDSSLYGSGSYTDWNGEFSFQFYRKAGGDGQSIHVKGNPTLWDVDELPFTGGLGPRGGRGIGYIGRYNKNWATDLIGLLNPRVSIGSFSSGDRFMDMAIKAVKGEREAENKPVIKTANGVTEVWYLDNEVMRISTRTPGTSRDVEKDSIVSYKGVVDSLFTKSEGWKTRLHTKKPNTDYIWQENYEE